MGWKEGELSFVCTHFCVAVHWKGDYIISIVASEPSAFPHWPTYSGLSDPDKDGAFRQFSRQETQARGVTPHYSQTHQSTQSAAERQKGRHQVIWFLTMGCVTSVWHTTRVEISRTSHFFSLHGDVTHFSLSLLQQTRRNWASGWHWSCRFAKWYSAFSQGLCSVSSGLLSGSQSRCAGLNSSQTGGATHFREVRSRILWNDVTLKVGVQQRGKTILLYTFWTKKKLFPFMPESYSK